MDWPVRPDGPPVRDGKPYCEIAHLARDGAPYLAIARWLREEAGLSAPEIYAADRPSGLYLIEDLGDGVFGALIQQGEALEPFYELAVEGLLAIRARAQSPIIGRDEPYRIPTFDRDALQIELELLLDWYFPFKNGTVPSALLRESFDQVWRPHLDWLEAQPTSLALRDFHSPNLLFLPERKGVARLGVIDFQDAVWVHPAYDLVSLLQDARLTVSEAVEKRLLALYCARVATSPAGTNEEDFRRAYSLLGAQRNTKILGIFARLSKRDGKHAYLAHMPRIVDYLRINLDHPALSGLRAWYDEHLFNSRAVRDGAEEADARSG
jgi:aminoglycoside/choline kinase family phosphotransferase